MYLFPLSIYHYLLNHRIIYLMYMTGKNVIESICLFSWKPLLPSSKAWLILLLHVDSRCSRPGHNLSFVTDTVNPMWQPVLQIPHIPREEIVYSSGSTSGLLISLGNQTETETTRLTDIKKNSLKQNIRLIISSLLMLCYDSSKSVQRLLLSMRL